MPANLDLNIGIHADAKGANATVKRLDQATDQLARTTRSGARASRRAARAQTELNTRTRRTAQAANSASRAMASYAHIVAGLYVARRLAGSILRTAAAFEQLRLRLEVFAGSAGAGAARFAELQDYAARTPFALQAVVDAFLRLEATNFAPNIDQFRALGDIAAASGRSINELADAIAGVGRGEHDPIEGFGFEVRREADQVRIAFKDTVRVVDTTRSAILAAFVDIARSNQAFVGATDKLANSLTGALSNLSDSVAQLQDRIGRAGLNAAINEVSRGLAEAATTAGGLADVVGAMAGGAVRTASALAPVAAVVGALWLNLKLTRAATLAFNSSATTTAARLARIAARGRTARAAIIGLNRAFRALGGPVGLALLAVEGIGLWALANQRAAAEVDSHMESLEALQARLKGLGAAGLELERLAQTARRFELDAQLRQDRARIAALEARKQRAQAGEKEIIPVFGHHPVWAAIQFTNQNQRQLLEARAAAEATRREFDRNAEKINLTQKRLNALNRGDGATDSAEDGSAEVRQQQAIISALHRRLAALREITETERVNEAIAAGQLTDPADQATALALARHIDFIEELEATSRQVEAYMEDVDRRRRQRAEEAARRAEAETRRRQDAIAGIAQAQLALGTAYDRGRAEVQGWRAATLAALNTAADGYQHYADQVEQITAERLARIAGEETAARLRASREWRDGAQRAFADYARHATDAATNVESAIVNGMRSAEDALAEFVGTGKLKFKSLVNSILADLARIAIRQAITGPLSAALSGALGGVFPGAGGAAATGPGWTATAANTFHGGGVAGELGGLRRQVNPAVFQAAPRYHRGGLAGNEVPAILERGEVVLSRTQVAALRSAPGSAPPVQIQFENRGTPQQPIEQTTRFDGRQWVINIITDDLARHGQVAQSLESHYALRGGIA